MIYMPCLHRSTWQDVCGSVSTCREQAEKVNLLAASLKLLCPTTTITYHSPPFPSKGFICTCLLPLARPMIPCAEGWAIRAGATSLPLSASLEALLVVRCFVHAKHMFGLEVLCLSCFAFGERSA